MEKIYKTDTKNGIKHKEVYTLKEEYAKLGLKGLIYYYEIEQNVLDEPAQLSKTESSIPLCSIYVYSLSKPRNLPDLNQSVLSNEMKNAIERNSKAEFYIYGKKPRKNEFFKNITKETIIYSKWLPASLMFAISAENIFEKTDVNGVIVNRKSSSLPEQWKQLELCLEDMERKSGRGHVQQAGNIINNDKLYEINENFLFRDNSAEFKDKITKTIFSDKSVIKIKDVIKCSFYYDSDDFFSRFVGYTVKNNYEKYGKSFGITQNSFIDIYNVDEKMYIRIFAKSNNGIPYVAQYCED